MFALVAVGCGADVTEQPIETPAVVARVDVFPTRDWITSFAYQRQFTARAYDANQQEIPDKTAQWASSAPSVATIDANGVLTPVWEGTSTITASVDGVTASAQVTVAPELIAFESDRTGNQDIFVAASDGSGVRNLSMNPGLDEAPRWSPDGARIAFRSERDGHSDIYVTNADGSGLLDVSNTSGGVSRYFDWAPDGTRIAFASVEGTGVEELYVVGADGSGLTPLTQCGCINDRPEWSRDGTRIAFQSVRDTATYPDIFTMAADGSDPVNVTNNPSADVYPRWSPDGQTILFLTGREGPWRLYTTSSTGADPRRLVNLSPGAAEWSPDGQWIAFVGTNSPYLPGLYLIRPDGTGRIPLVEGQSFGDLDWSQDSQELVYNYSSVAPGPTYSSIAIVHLDGSHETIVGGLVNNWMPRIRPRRP